MHQGLERVQIQGGLYMTCCLSSRSTNHAQTVANYSIIAKRAVDTVLNPLTSTPFKFKMGIHTGTIVLARVGLNSGLSYFGRTFSVVKQVASTCDYGRIHCTVDTVSLLSGPSADSLMPILNFKQRVDTITIEEISIETYWLEVPRKTPFVVDLIFKCHAIIKNKLDANEDEVEEPDVDVDTCGDNMVIRIVP